ncbi:hypothetical protein L1887_60159 [Cichorium endivia]|nr:hypothetical protein L1887_60159 [Cichorium endivia]
MCSATSDPFDVGGAGEEILEAQIEQLQLLVGTVGEALVHLGHQQGCLGLDHGKQRWMADHVVVQLYEQLRDRIALSCDHTHLVADVVKGVALLGARVHVDIAIAACIRLDAYRVGKARDDTAGHDAGDLHDGCRRDGALVVARHAVQARGGLEIGDRTTQIAVRRADERVEHLVVLKRDRLGVCDHLEPRLGGRGVERAEAELAASRRQRLDDARHIVAHEAEARDAAVLLHDATQRTLRILRHAVRLVEDDDLERRARETFLGIGHRQLGKVLDLFAHHRDAALVRGVELQHTRLHQLGPKQLPRERQDGRRLARAGRTVEEHVGKIVGHECLFEHRDGMLLCRHLVDRLGTVLFHPRSPRRLLLGELLLLRCLAGIVRLGGLLQEHDRVELKRTLVLWWVCER